MDITFVAKFKIAIPHDLGFKRTSYYVQLIQSITEETLKII
jgi:hypothetical protein